MLTGRRMPTAPLSITDNSTDSREEACDREVGGVVAEAAKPRDTAPLELFPALIRLPRYSPTFHKITSVHSAESIAQVSGRRRAPKPFPEIERAYWCDLSVRIKRFSTNFLLPSVSNLLINFRSSGAPTAWSRTRSKGSRHEVSAASTLRFLPFEQLC